MTRVVYDSSDFTLTMDGHARSGIIGEDLVCSALSMLMYTLEAALTDHKEALLPSIGKADGHARFHCSPTKGNKTMCKTIFATIFSGFELLANQYPQNVTAIKREQEG